MAEQLVTKLSLTVHPELKPELFDDIKESAPHGSPFDRGSADAYYGRPYDPHWWPQGTGMGTRIEEEAMSPREIELYTFAYRNEDDRKDWG